MESKLARRPIFNLWLNQSPRHFSFNLGSRRYESSYRRSKSRLNIKPDPSFLISNHSPRSDHIIFNPPSSAPSVFHTPPKFLPLNDKRRELLNATASQLESSDAKLAPPMRPKKVDLPRGHLKEAEIKEMQDLHMQNPNVWTNKKLANKFNCSNIFVSVCLKHCVSGDPAARKAEMKAKWEYVASKWGPRRKKAREDTKKRYEAALRDE